MTTQGKRLKRIRQELELTQDEFGKSIGISKQFLSNIETDKTPLNNEKLALLYTKYNVDLNYLIGGAGTPFRSNEFKNVGKEIITNIETILKNKGLL